MSKELVISSTRHETRLGVIDNDELVEIFVERESQEGLAGSIHKGRVTRVLPGMQSAFVDVGLERDAFLYVSDFVDSSSEFDDSEEEGSSSGSTRRKSGRSRRKPGRDSEPKPETAAEAKPESESESESESEPDKEPREAGTAEEREREGGRDRRGRRRRGRRGRRRGGREGKEGLPESKYADLADKDKKGEKADEASEPKANKAAAPRAATRAAKAPEEEENESSFELLPGESLAKYGDADEDDRYTDEPDDSDATPDDSDRAEQESDENEEEEDLTPEEDDEEDQGDESDEAEDDESDDEDDDEDDGPNFAHDLEEAERLAALVEEQDAENGEESEEESEDDRSEDNDASGDESDPDDDGGEDDSDSENDDDETADQQDDQPESEAGDTEDDRNEEDGDGQDSEDSGDNEEDSVEQPGEPQEKDTDKASERTHEERSASGVTMPGAPVDEDDDADKSNESGEEDEASVPGQPDSASVRGRSGSSRNLQRRGRRGRRRGGRGRDNRQPVQEKDPQERERRKPMREPMQVSGSNTSEYKITDMLQKGNEILIQIAKEPLGKKGARITSHIALPGRFLVYMPTVDHVGVSRKISTFEERKRLRNIVRTHRTGMPGGFIVRTAGDGIPEEEIRGDMLFLYNLWLDIRQKAEEREHPGLVHQDLDIVERILRDQLDDDFKAIWVDDEAEYERILRFVERFQPSLLPKVKLYTRTKPIFEEFNVHTAIEKALRAKVWLKSGGYLVINQTEALVSVDVNTGKYVGKSDRLEDTIVNTNVEAAKELVRQLRLRDLGGIIVVDFIDMDDRKNRQKVLQALEQDLKSDRAPSKVLQFNDFGLVAITRKRVKQSLERTLCDPCPTCSGSGSLKSVTTVIFEILAEAKKMAPDMEPQKDITLRVNPEVARTLKDRQNSYLQELETALKSRILVRSDGSLHRENFDVN